MAPSLQSILSTSSSPMGRVEKATSSLLMGPNWMMNMEISNSVNSNPWKAKAFVKAVKKRLQNKNSKVQFLALTLLETMIKNCGDFVHFQVVELGILQEIVKIVRKTRNMQVREKILVLLESWQETFGGPNGKYPQYYYTYAELKRSGLRFPQNQRDDDLPITNQPQVGYGMPSDSVERLDEVMASESFSDLANIQNVMDLLNNMLQAVNPKDQSTIKDEVLIDLANQCRLNQKKLMRLINTTENDSLLGEALVMNDNLQILISKHDALTRPSAPTLLDPAMIEQSDDREDEEDGFSHLANRNSVLKPTEEQEVSPNKNEIKTTLSLTSAAEGSSSISSNALIVFDPPGQTDSSKNEVDMIDLLSLTLSENQSPQTEPVPPPPPPQSNQNQNQFSSSHINVEYHNYPQSLMSNKAYTTSNSYIAPWAEPDVVQLTQKSPVFPQPLPQYPTDYLATSWTSPEASLNPFLSTTYTQNQYAESQYSLPLSSYASNVTAQDSKAPQNLKLFRSKETNLNANLKLTEPSTAPKPYMPDNLFEDLIKLRNSDGSLKSRNASSLWGFSGQGMASVN
ncbi:TOM1-like protein 6 [Dendrobium catenatum]|uniref:TOM1-like protein 2 n=1 Tax=Dendrobium catenatum TaxID=906689 RepID=A0A2I0WHN9_9ASPA|nr:TOM1-like protein 6 [Dendrobium catenatum]PKU75161.1 hypothetical protein MA16_Dca015517 [Dendrobium catenatum]